MEEVAEGMDLVTCYEEVRRWYREHVGEVASRPERWAKWSADLIDHLPPASEATSGEMRAVLLEVLHGGLSWGVEQASDELSNRDYALAGLAGSERLSARDLHDIREGDLGAHLVLSIAPPRAPETSTLTNEQRRLLSFAVKASRSSAAERRPFIVAESKEGAHLLHPGLANGQIEVYPRDLDELADQGLLRLSRGSHGSRTFDVTNLGFEYADRLNATLDAQRAAASHEITGPGKSTAEDASSQPAPPWWTSINTWLGAEAKRRGRVWGVLAALTALALAALALL